MEALTRLVSESLARHGFDRPLDYRRLQWSRWFRCDSHHSLLQVPSKSGVFAIAEEVAQVCGASEPHMRRPEQSEGSLAQNGMSPISENQSPAGQSRRMLAVVQFFEDDDMAFVLDRMLSRQGAMRSRLETGRYFVRYVVIEDPAQRRNIAGALNQWIASSAEKASGIGSHFATSLELTPATEFVPPADSAQASLFDPSESQPVSLQGPSADSKTNFGSKSNSKPGSVTVSVAAHLDSGAAANIHCPSPLPSGF